MRSIKKVLFIVDGGVTPKTQLKNIIESGCTEQGYTAVEYPVDSSGDISLYYKITNDE